MRKVLLLALLLCVLGLGTTSGSAAAAPASSNASIGSYEENFPGAGGGQNKGGGHHHRRHHHRRHHHRHHHGGGQGGSGGNSKGASGGSGSGGGGSSATAGAIPAAAASQLAHDGASGRHLSNLVQKTAPGPGNAAASRDVGSASSSGLVDSVGDTVGGILSGSDTGLGAAFPILLALILFGALAVMLTRRRRLQSPSPRG
jgi:hypothetical protein